MSSTCAAISAAWSVRHPVPSAGSFRPTSAQAGRPAAWTRATSAGPDGATTQSDHKRTMPTLGQIGGQVALLVHEGERRFRGSERAQPAHFVHGPQSEDQLGFGAMLVHLAEDRGEIGLLDVEQQPHGPAADDV